MPDDIEIKRFISMYDIKNVRIRSENRSVFNQNFLNNLNNLYDGYVNDNIRHEEVPVINMDIDQKHLYSIIEKVLEMENLMRDPETAKMLMEARFINRLKYGTKI